MSRFYRNIWQKKLNKIDGLREAQLYLLSHPEVLETKGLRNVRSEVGALPSRAIEIQATKSVGTNPYFWAAFQLSGDWR